MIDGFYLEGFVESRVAAVNALVEECASEHGVGLPSELPGDMVEGYFRADFLYGVVTAEEAGESGYEPYRLVDPLAEVTAQGWSEEVVSVVLGTADVEGDWTGGCLDEAEAAVDADSTVGSNPLADDGKLLVELLLEQAWGLSVFEEDVQEVLSDWTECMKNRGYEYGNYFEPPLDQRFARTTSESPSDEELQTALDDVECKAETNIFGVIGQIDNAFQERLSDINAQQLNAELTWMEAAIERYEGITAR
ncbi:hypothetical protein AB0B28_06605 [Glycomyces sp. NPDC046736]|uniref:hypothetical protein n=1 Tax=Glycomyces sp. NPDC046736 TaxID=3155615 RepID=UPI0033E22A87